MTQKHTPGPWTLLAGRTFDTPSGQFYLAYGKDKHGNANFRDFCELDRNARLISAAPDLLDALQSASEVIESLWEQIGEPPGIAEVTLNEIRAAISKATGK